MFNYIDSLCASTQDYVNEFFAYPDYVEFCEQLGNSTYDCSPEEMSDDEEVTLPF